MKRSALIIMFALATVACGDEAEVTGPDDATVQALVKDAVAARCSAASLSAVTASGAAPAQVRAGLRAVHAASLAAQPQTGLSHGHTIKADSTVPELSGVAFDFTLHLPKGYPGAGPWPLWVDPAHPTSKLKDDTWLPYMDQKLGGQFILVTVNFMNRIFKTFDEAKRKKVFGRGIAVDQDYFSVLDAAIAQVKRAYRVDPARVYVSGVSAKGASSWFHGIASAQTYAAVHPVSIIPAPFDPDLWKNLLGVPALVWQGKADTITPFTSVDPMITKLKGYGLNIEYWVEEKGGHGGALYYKKVPDAAKWLLKRKRNLHPGAVHKGIFSARSTEAYWLKVTALAAAPDESKKIYPTAPAAVVAATWSGNKIALGRVEGVSALELRWMQGPAGPGKGQAGEKVSVSTAGKPAREHELKEDLTVALEDYCMHGDDTRLWWGRVKVSLP